ncbi:MAG TPA: phosphoribosyltransferase [Clostridiales bacterium]|nr:phosphoribosyltransferase [Clostridiales bacterium]
MESRAFTVSLDKNPSISLKVIPGHFTTSHFHTTHYLDLDNLKTNTSVARDVARELALPYLASTLVDTIVCMEGTSVIGAYMAEELSQQGMSIINSGREIHVVTPISNIHRKLMFKGNLQQLIVDRNIIVLVSTISSGITLNSALECLSYYGGKPVGISTLFNACPQRHEQEIHSMFTNEDIPNYQTFKPNECPMCKKGRKLDAIIVHDGYIET